MLEPALTSDEAERLASLHRLGILDTPPEERYDRITRIAALSVHAPVALVSLVDADRQWSKSRYGTDIVEIPRSVSFCGHAIHEDSVLVVPDALVDERFANNPLVTSGPMVRFYAGVSLKSQSGHRLGTLCVIDYRPRVITPVQLAVLRELARLVEREFERGPEPMPKRDSVSVPVAASVSVPAPGASARLGREVPGDTGMAAPSHGDASSRVLVDLAPIGIFQTDGAGRYVHVNPRWGEITGVARSGALGAGWTSGLHPEDGQRVQAEWADAVREARDYRAEYRFQSEDARVTWVSVRAVPHLDDNDRLVGYLGIVEDITGRRAVEYALRTSQEIHRSVIDTVGEGIIIQDQAAEVVGCNAAAERILGLGIHRLVDWTVPDRSWAAVRADGSPFPPEEHPIAVTLQTGRPCADTVMGIGGPDGQRRWLTVRSQPLSWDGVSAPWGVTCTFADITDRWRAR